VQHYRFSNANLIVRDFDVYNERITFYGKETSAGSNAFVIATDISQISSLSGSYYTLTTVALTQAQETYTDFNLLSGSSGKPSYATTDGVAMTMIDDTIKILVDDNLDIIPDLTDQSFLQIQKNNGIFTAVIDQTCSASGKTSMRYELLEAGLNTLPSFITYDSNNALLSVDTSHIDIVDDQIYTFELIVYYSQNTNQQMIYVQVASCTILN
jgi:hypothetical protein